MGVEYNQFSTTHGSCLKIEYSDGPPVDQIPDAWMCAKDDKSLNNQFMMNVYDMMMADGNNKPQFRM